MYGPLTGKQRDSDYSLPALEVDDPDSWSCIEKLHRDVFSDGVEDRNRSIILAAASGLQLSGDVRAIEPRVSNAGAVGSAVPYTFGPILTLVRECRGFHVGSYENKLLKRSLYCTEISTIVFIHGDKSDCEIEVGKCHFLCDQRYRWKTVTETHPLSIWVGCHRETYDQLIQKLQHCLPASWRFRSYGNGEYPVVIGHNDAFRQCWRAAGISVFQ
jgi:hypothetical protein